MTQVWTAPTTIATGFGLMLAASVWAAAPTQAQPAPAGPAAATRPTDVSAQQRDRQPPRRLRIYPRDRSYGVIPHYDPGPNAKRECTATYVEEHRPSGTVITPRMNCWWRPG